MNDTRLSSRRAPPQAMRRVAVLINPAAGRERPVLAPLNRILREAGIEWWPQVLQPDSEPSCVEQALRRRPDAIWVYGGDGTVSNVASAMLQLQGDDCPLVPLGGGTANALAEALGAPADLEETLQQLCLGHYEWRRTDVGMVGKRAFLLRASIGASAGLTNRTSREEKDRLGLLAYFLSGVRALGEREPRRFHLVVDGEPLEREAISVIVANSAGTGFRTDLASRVSDHDRRLDVLLVPSFGWVTRALANAALGEGLMDGCPRSFANESVSVSCDEPVAVHLDGESIGDTPVSLSVRPAAITLLRYSPP